VSCVCNADHGSGDYDCPDEAFSWVNIAVIDHGTCWDPLEFCFDEDPCQWEYSMYYKSTEDDAIMRVHWNGHVRQEIVGAEIQIGPLGQQLDCGNLASVGIGSNGLICIEALFECQDCP
jgi:hypothetical protein